MSDLISVAEWRRILREEGIQQPVPVFPGALTRQHGALRRRIKAATYCLVRNDGALSGERFRCRNHSMGPFDEPVYHAYFTCMCTDLPFAGLDEALYAYATTTFDEDLERRIVQWAPHLASGHPNMAKAAKPSAPGEDLISLAVAVVEPIDHDLAQRLADEINAKNPPQRVVIQRMPEVKANAQILVRP